MTIVAIAAEGEYDGEVIRYLISQIVASPIVRWTGTYAFNGCKSVAKLAPAFLASAERAGIRHAVLAIDNDGGARRALEHQPGHVPAPFDPQDGNSCRECWLHQAVPSSWIATGKKHCIAVPVQTIETWLLAIRGTPLSPSPEATYDRAKLKRLFFGKPKPDVAGCVARAMIELQKPLALDILAARPSFQRFASQLTAWP